MKFPPRPSRPREIPSIFSWCSGEARNRLSLQYSMHVDFSLSLYVYIYIYTYIQTNIIHLYIYIYIGITDNDPVWISNLRIHQKYQKPVMYVFYICMHCHLFFCFIYRSNVFLDVDMYIYIYIVCGACKPTNATRRGPSYFCLAVHWPPLVFPGEKSLWWSLWYVSGLIIQSFILIIIW